MSDENMNGNLGDFDAEQVEPKRDFDPLPAGLYPAIITESVMEPTKDGSGKFLKLTLQITSGEYEGRTLFDRLNLQNPNEKAVEIARATLSSICRAVGVMRPGDSAQLHERPMVIKVAVRKRTDPGHEGELSNEVKGYMAPGEVASTAKAGAPAAAGKPAPWAKKK